MCELSDPVLGIYSIMFDSGCSSCNCPGPGTNAIIPVLFVHHGRRNRGVPI
ncbi:hypothetical protein BACCAP_04093 [Pseudoflavonifractor capillosus ATCC 29799]|uniref:Uncharacterized protein n=1 Tax=Pseudoflavonifractor capillosus ATCC 29799 TaxID=411467 RepID=A6P0S7_9FIRM|nr:hypothetical protein BACCAP_04093 [Pseudoflavonifractor capillosus ATCC 29799]